MKKILFSLILFIVFHQACFSQESAVIINATDAVTRNDPRADTVRAIKHLFERKRKGGVTRAIVFGVLFTVSVVNTISYQPEYVNVNQGSAGTQRVDISSSPDPAGYIFMAFSGVMTITGITQHAKYNALNLESVLEEYEQGSLPPKVKLKLRKKDFK